MLILLLFVLETVQAADPYPRNEAIDVTHYVFRLELNDSTNRIGGETVIDIRFRKAVADFELDLVNNNAQGSGMTVSEVLLNNQPLKFSHQNDRLKIQLSPAAQSGDDKKFTIRYSGIPQDGLVIGKNKFGDRTFFGDNWPNRAHHWLPTIDHPYEKATCEFIVLAPEHYTIVGTGQKVEESAIGKNRKLTHWKTSVLLPTKVMVIGAARFAIEYVGTVNNVPLESWVYPQNRTEGFSDYSIAAKPLDFLCKVIAPYPYEKLANVQSKTRFGGMENASNIFYFENSVTGKSTIEGLVAHEIAHQWFGNSASEADWYHVWLSEGFATYFANLYFESTYGSQRLMEEMETDRKQVVAYFEKNPSPVVNTSITDITKVLNTNSYQKASWVLHMLRHEIGDQKFMEGVREYYRQFQFSNAMTDDFRRVMEKASGKDLNGFFEQWLFKAGHPKLEIVWQYEPRQKQVRVLLEQKQEQTFDFPLDLSLGQPAGMGSIETVKITSRKQEFIIPAAQMPVDVTLDPNVWLLFEGSVRQAAKSQGK